MTQLYACYEKTHTGWQLVVYHDGRPEKPVGSQPPERTAIYEVPSEMVDVDGTPNMGLISKAYPKPTMDLKDETR